jgi:hypothetical protein
MATAQLPEIPERFILFTELQDFLAEHAGGTPHDYSIDKASTIEVADSLGIGSQAREIIAVTRETWPAIEASVDRARRAQVATVEPLRSPTRLRGVPAGPPPSAAPIPGYTIASVWEGYSPPPYLVRRVLGPGELTVLFGQSGHFKSVIAADLALSVGSGRDFHGLKARRGGVLYVAGEGHVGIRKRFRAWLLERDYNASSEQPLVYVTCAGADLFGNPLQLRATADQAAEQLGAPIELVIVDTLAANFGAGDENHASDMQLAIDTARRAAPGAATLVLHHSGHGQAERERGSYALVASADCRLQATYDEVSKSIELRWHKLKDDEQPAPMLFAWKAVSLDWRDEDDQELTSVVLERLPNGGAGAAAPTGRNQALVLRTLLALLAKARKNLADDGRDPAEARILMDGLRRELEKRDMPRNRFHEALKGLQEAGHVSVDGVVITPREAAP